MNTKKRKGMKKNAIKKANHHIKMLKWAVDKNPNDNSGIAFDQIQALLETRNQNIIKRKGK